MKDKSFGSENYFGSCPECNGTHGYMNVSKVHFFVCDDHKTKWVAGVNLFSPHDDDNMETWVKNADLLATYRDVEPIYTDEADEVEGVE